MAKRREDRDRKTWKDPDCNLDGDYRSPIKTFQDLTAANIASDLKNSRYLQLLLSLTIIGAILRFLNLGYNSLWLDEASTVTYSVQSLPAIWEATAGGEFNPPLFYWIEHIMLTFGNNEVTLRFVPALLGVLTIPVVYCIGKEFVNRNVGIIAVAAVTVSPFLVYYSQEARAYAAMLFFIALAMLFCLRALKSNDILNWVLFGVFSALAFWTHFYGLVMVGALVLYSLYELLPKIRSDISSIKPIVAGGAALVILTLPLILVTLQLFTKRTSSAPTFGIQGVGIIIETFRQISGFSDIAMFILLILFVLGIIQAYLLDKNKAVFLISLTLLTFLISYVLSYRIPMMPRYLIFLSIVYFIGIAVSSHFFCNLLGNKVVVYGFIVLFVVLAAIPLAGYYSGYSKDDWKGFSGQIAKVTKTGDYVVVAPGYVYQPFDYYYSNTTDGTIELHADTAADFAALQQQKGNATMYLVVTSDIASADPTGRAISWLENNAKLVSQNTGIYLFTVS